MCWQWSFKIHDRRWQKEPHGKSWRRREHSKDIEETKISNIKKVSQDDEVFNSVVDNIDIHYDKNKDDEEGISHSCGTEDGCFFYKKKSHIT